MSKIEHAKRISKRLLKLANTFPQNKIEIKTLAEAFKCVASINGYKDWHDYQENLIRQDYISNNEIPKRDITSINKFEPIYETTPKTTFNIPNVNIVQYTIVKDNKQKLPILLGYTKINKPFTKPKEHQLTEYPLLVSGSTGAGKTEALFSLMAQHISNQEGAIYVDCKGSVDIYIKTLSICQEYKKTKDLFVLNLCSTYDNSAPNKKTSNSIDPINPLIGHRKELKNLLGDFVGTLIDEIGLELRKQNKAINLEILEQIVSLPSLFNLYNQDIFQEKSKELLTNYFISTLNIINIEDFYLNKISTENKNIILKQHIANFNQLKNFINTLIAFPHVFKTEHPDFSFDQAYAEKKVVCVLLPALEKSPSEIQLLSDIIMYQIYISSKTFDSMDRTSIYQNVIIDDLRYNISNNLSKEMMLTLPTSTNWIFGIQDFSEYNHHNKIDFIISKCNSFAFMKCEDTHSIPDKLIGKILRNSQNNHHLFSHSSELRSMSCGEAWVFQNKKLEFLQLGYKNIKPIEYVFLPN